ncbi:high-affinity iron transporter [Chromohalobacter marismortui]|uniref:High-affinity iron transporter n=1 Tax=Chromohalobacter marismortui TaxID=42055 RepID=A0A4V3F527_9GAMM|nr:MULTISPECIES: iron uptake transporter permease EfeU [Chromohalobacter]MCI0509467.1 FTR1 family protein [Chromohalobacter sp.]MCI0592639.1 FTR1 family protein [Chromohalobacter sp.]TDU22186.1 high-affinity iron transporter [Chromohalobacter marismortui]
MLVPFLIMLREGLEAALIVGIIASYLRQTGRGAWMPAVWIGVFLAVALALGVGAGLQFASAEFPQRQQELFEALVGLIAVGVLTWMVFWMRRTARGMRRSLTGALDDAFESGHRQTLALIGMVFLAVAREGLESIFFLLAVFQQSTDQVAPWGALLGILTALLVGLALYRGSLRLNLAHFFRVTGLFILLVAAGLLAGSVRALHEAGLWNHAQQILFNLGDQLPLDSPLGAVFAGVFGYQPAPTVSEAVVYVGYLLVTLLLFLRPARLAQSAAPHVNAR